jgi:hypothetical protein
MTSVEQELHMSTAPSACGSRYPLFDEQVDALATGRELAMPPKKVAEEIADVASISGQHGLESS